MHHRKVEISQPGVHLYFEFTSHQILYIQVHPAVLLLCTYSDQGDRKPGDSGRQRGAQVTHSQIMKTILQSNKAGKES